MNGIINIFKPKGMTSHDVVNQLRKITGIKRIGHTGTLDPEVSGVLPLCIGKATRVSEYLLNLDKEYVGELTLGSETDTQDFYGNITNKSDKEVSELEIIKTAKSYEGNIEQIPPMYSALKHKGKKLYELAREGKIIERKPRDATIYDFNIFNIKNNKKIMFYIKCSKGTYIRTICNDIGLQLGTYGYMSYLIRIGVGNFKIEDSYSIEYISKLDVEDIKKIITPMDLAISHINKIEVPDVFYSKIKNGAFVPTNFKDKKYENHHRIYCRGEFMGIGSIIFENSSEYLKMNKVLI